ncbi:leukotriene A-4 hydrolase-like [Neocloeon triangulifer]|uniref:leukotriene A-4 hydrolase-like n=1 Tax=Neocloeon triangulifer TaxID=2078957 RepID=UPI00286F4FE9|nr:leukotriene A-4 hydrolase-like [Neocloeon triangulifer]
MGIDALSKNDPSSFSNTEDVVVRHAHISWLVDFKKQTLAGSVRLTLEKVIDTVNKVVLDIKDIDVTKVTFDGEILEFVKGPTVGTFGESLTITLPVNVPKTFNVIIQYESSSKAYALQWLSPEQTAGKTHPYMFSQCQSIHCRTIMPCQDTPDVKFTYSAEVDADAKLTVLLSGVSTGTPEALPGTTLRRHKFEQRVTIPSYLLAIVVAKISFRTISPRVNVWAEEQNVEAAAWEFGQAEEQLKFAEEICGPYEWGRYDLLILPPSFGYGGMENPCITFVTPTCVVGDRTQADVIAHEISHSWTGNSVGIKNFEHFWLNEGWTMFVQRKIESKLFGEKHRHFSAILGLNELRNTVNDSKHPEIETNLVKNLVGIDPEDVFNTVPYEKGHTLLFYLETLLGGPEAFDPFVKSYCQHFKGRAITTDDFKAYLYEFFASKKDVLDSVDWQTWFFGLGMPPVIPDYDKTLSEQCTILVQKWLKCPEAEIDTLNSSPGYKDLSPLQQREFFDQLGLSDEIISIKKLEKLDEWYNLKTVRNTEVKFRWLRLCIKAQWEAKIGDAIEFATIQGRMKFVRPLFRSMYAWPAARDRAVEAFKAHRDEYMYITARLVALDLHLET